MDQWTICLVHRCFQWNAQSAEKAQNSKLKKNFKLQNPAQKQRPFPLELVNWSLSWALNFGL